MIRTAIAGIISLNNNPLDKHHIETITNKLVHRGKFILLDPKNNISSPRLDELNSPTQVFLQYYLGAKDPSLIEKNDETTIIYSGYPIGDLKEDTKSLKGYFAIAKISNSKLTLYRDRLGIKPLYYVMNSALGIFAFASERKAIRQFGSPERLPPGFKLEISKKTINLQAYNTLPQYHPDPKISFDHATKQLEKLIIESIKIFGSKNTAILFSGGLDSSTLAVISKRFFDIKLFSVAFPESRDHQYVEKATEELGADLVFVELSLSDLEHLVKDTIRIIEEYDPLKVSIGIPLLVALRTISREGYRIAFAGQGADELFGGYAKYLRIPNKDALISQMHQDITTLAEKNLERDEHLAGSVGIDLRLPYLFDDIVDLALKLPISYKLKNNIRKFILRVVAEHLGVPDSIAQAPKKAIQYSTGTMKFLKKLAKKHNMDLKSYLSKIYSTFYG